MLTLAVYMFLVMCMLGVSRKAKVLNKYQCISFRVVLNRVWCVSANKTIKGIRWSEGLDAHFKDNYQSDPTLSWQYFGSSTGFMRHYPGKKV